MSYSEEHQREMEEISLYGYQEEVVQPALEGRNIIIWLPTGGGKTRAAVYVAKKHLESTPGAKVAVLVNKVHLVDQHYNKEFQPFLGGRHKILENSLRSAEEDRHVELTGFTLLIIDEGAPKPPGAQWSTSCRSVPTWMPRSSCLPRKLPENCRRRSPKPMKKYDIVNERLKDPFGDHLKWMMSEIHDFTAEKNIRMDFGSQEYEADVVLLEKQASVQGNRMLAQCARHLRQYNDALLINDTVRMTDAFQLLEEFYNREMERRIGLDDTDHFLFDLFRENKAKLQLLAALTQFENPKLEQLQKTLLDQFGGQNYSRGILFSKTRMSTHFLFDWVSANRPMQDAGIKAATLTGAGNQANHMTQKDQKQTIQQFREGALNLLISTSVAEEGLDIPECNLVVRYGLMTNEIAMQQASGRARAEDSKYSVVAQRGGQEVRREQTNEYLEELSKRAIAEVQSMDQLNFQQQVAELQRQNVISLQLAELQLEKMRTRCPASSFQLHCRLCNTAVAHGDDMQLIDGTHHVNINPHFEVYYKAGEKVHLDGPFKDWEPGCLISCANCGKEWGMEMIYKAVTLPNLAIKNFVLQSPGGRKPVKKWKDVPFRIEEFNYTDYVLKKFPDLL
ncbi:hypothetical protein SKAU_G00288980 [Synaphobranchus kaupii]|uniref:RNA helicase n=1 Tax=Synaphobranchus kaupii TaxID=118154 RepID=A0A9Q1ETF3_SYNKA|nr:hypothetical protein SKAU_G00288980 [Synaphobranchus kaupii]